MLGKQYIVVETYSDDVKGYSKHQEQIHTSTFLYTCQHAIFWNVYKTSGKKYKMYKIWYCIWYFTSSIYSQHNSGLLGIKYRASRVHTDRELGVLQKHNTYIKLLNAFAAMRASGPKRILKESLDCLGGSRTIYIRDWCNPRCIQGQNLLNPGIFGPTTA